MGWALFPASSKASVQDDLASARAAVQNLESQLTSAQNQLNIDTQTDRKSTRLNSSHSQQSRMPSSA